jgi:hypothetical protein
MAFIAQSNLADIGRRLVALVCAAIVLGLVICAASPELHHKLHVGDTDTSGDTCAVVLFAAGVAATVAAIVVAAPRMVYFDRAPLSPARIFVAQPRYLRQPERGPPNLG